MQIDDPVPEQVDARLNMVIASDIAGEVNGLQVNAVGNVGDGALVHGQILPAPGRTSS